ncbi:MAG: tRNA glutamyl-Q(34) synthetase GluQRS [Steroidobacteraceae bacterium]
MPIGRFAPSPTGRLHLGSVLSAVGSYLAARAEGGRWLVRMEDLDTPRVIPGADSEILSTLERLGLEWHGEVLYQSRRAEAYFDALDTLKAKGLLFACTCSRTSLVGTDEATSTPRYPGLCRHRPPVFERGHAALRFRAATDASLVAFQDLYQGYRQEDVAATTGDFIALRRDGIPSYHLAVVVDDAAQGVTQVIRGADLIDSVPRQVLLQRSLGLPQPRYGHLPLVTEPDGTKLSKSRRSVPAGLEAPGTLLLRVLRLLRQDPPEALRGAPPAEILAWAASQWRPEAFFGSLEIPADFPG